MVTALWMTLLFTWFMGLILLAIVLNYENAKTPKTAITGFWAILFALLWPIVILFATIASVLPARWQWRLQSWLRSG